MTIEEFDNMRFGAGMYAIIKGLRHSVVSVNLDQKLIGVVEYGDTSEIYWYRCENVVIEKAPSLFDQLATLNRP